MRKWGVVVSVLYAVVLLVLLVPAGIFLARGDLSERQNLWKNTIETYQNWEFWIVAVAILASQALLLFLPVDTTQKRLKPRSHVLISCSAAGILTALLTSAVVWSIGFAAGGENFWDNTFKYDWQIFRFWGALWLAWGVVFFLYLRNSSDAVTRVLSWLLKGSVLELLIVVPCHIIVRRRHDCSAPMATSFGIVGGIAVMLICFGPSVLFLYKKRLDSYSTRGSA